MGAVKETIDFAKELLNAIKNHQKNEKKDQYIHKLEDLGVKVCKENIKLKEQIKKLENNEPVLNENHVKVLKLLMENDKVLSKETLKRKAIALIGDEFDLVYYQLKKLEYIDVMTKPQSSLVFIKLTSDNDKMIKIIEKINEYEKNINWTILSYFFVLL